MSYTIIAIIYNPNSTGPSEELARELQGSLQAELPRQKIKLIATTHAGHGEELAYEIARKSKRPLIISSSGDGGYHEVINGALKAQSEGATPMTGILPAGNANDHYRNLHKKDLVAAIVARKPRSIDVLKLAAISKGEHIERYAHSYIGFGLTPIVGNELNKTTLNPLKEAWIVAHALFSLKPVRLKVGTKVRRYESIIFSNIDEMSKYMKISKPSSVTDGKFEVTIFGRRNKLHLIRTLVKSTMSGVRHSSRVNEYHMETVSTTLAQADGEIITLDAHTKVDITIEKQALDCFV